MKILKYILISAIVAFFAAACNEGIDPISYVAPGEDETAPVVTISYPAEGTEIKVIEPVTSVNIEFEVTDDIEIGSISVLMDGSEIASYNEFKDYRHAVEEYLYENLTTGAHVLTITAKDLEGKTTTKTVNFMKAPPYVPVHDGEVFYMPFDGDYMELVSITNATKVGTPGFAGEGVLGNNSYAGASGAYLTFPAESLMGDEFSAAFWMKINAVPDRAGILVIGPPDAAKPDAQNVRTSGFRFFRENAGGKQRFKLNVGTGDSDSWFDGGVAADVDPATDEWVHFAFTISQSEAVVYINGKVASEGAFAGVDWTNCDIMSIMSGAPRFTEWNHKSDESYMDELRIFNKALSQEEVVDVIGTDLAGQYEPKYDGETFYMPFNDTYKEFVNGGEATEVGSPGFAGESIAGSNAFAGAADSYLTFSTEGLTGSEFSAAFWYKVDPDPDRAGILVVGPPDAANPDAQNVRTSGFRFFREGGATNQIFKLNVGTGDGEAWFDGGAAATVDPTAVDWIHLAFTISGTECVVYINGEVVKQGEFTGIDWTDCDILSIGSGAPRFTGWNHLSDNSFIDELRLFNKALSQTEVQTIMNDN